jgi:hypothetical protein
MTWVQARIPGSLASPEIVRKKRTGMSLLEASSQPVVSEAEAMACCWQPVGHRGDDAVAWFWSHAGYEAASEVEGVSPLQLFKP